MTRLQPSILALGILAALSMGAAWLLPSTFTSVMLGWVSIFAIVILFLSPAPLWFVWIIGGLTHAIGFYWLPGTISYFGGFPFSLALLIALLFCLVGGLQYLLACFVTRRLPEFTRRGGYAVAIAWITIETIWIRIFPWMPGHTQISWTSFAQIADIGGVPLITLAMFSIAENALAVFNTQRVVFPALRLVGILGLSLFYGQYRIATISEALSEATSVRVIMPQANVTIEERNQQRFFAKNTDRYMTLSKQALDRYDSGLIIWPEAVSYDAIPTTLTHVTEARGVRVPYFGTNAAMVFGSLTFSPPHEADREYKFYNSAVALHSDGGVAGMYHKQILMPFGEYMPFSDIFPFLQNLNPMAAGAFTPGKQVDVYPVKLGDKFIPLSPLICYEDMMPKLSRRATAQGARLLLSLSNDGWFRETMAPYQHHLIASFRSIENRRYFLRATNTGITAVINPLGVTEASLRPFSENILVQDARLLTISSPFMNKLLSCFSLIVSSLCTVFLAIAFLPDRTSKGSSDK